MDDIIGLLLWVMILGIYLIPTLIAWLQQHHQLYAVAALNLLLGWTLVGWIGSLVWAFKSEEPVPNRKKLAGQNHQKHRRKSTARTPPHHPLAPSDLARRLAELKPHLMIEETLGQAACRRKWDSDTSASRPPSCLSGCGFTHLRSSKDQDLLKNGTL